MQMQIIHVIAQKKKTPINTLEVNGIETFIERYR